MEDIIRRVLKEETLKNNKKQLLFKLWDRERSAGKKPTINNSLTKALNISLYQLKSYLLEWYGGFDKVFNDIKTKLKNKIISTDIFGDYGIDVGGYDFKFKLPKFEKHNTPGGGFEIDVDCEIIDGGVDLITTGEYIDLTQNIEDDNLNWEIYNEIRDIISDIINKIMSQYGLDADLEDINFSRI